ncbi:MAG: glycosyltransferase family 2 protein [Oscillospiraceae bacterium]|nr:glycosyltransferase family 2 protein [Oscillospiraceae bacterium]
MSGKPFFTIAIPMYNAEKYITKSIESILTQSFDDFEILVVNDGSADNGGEVVKACAEKDDRIRYIEKENGGVSSARNCAIYNAKGRYIFFLDSDDILWENSLENAYKAVTENNFPQIVQTSRVKELDGKLIYCHVEDEQYDFAKEGLTKDERAIRVWYDKPMAGSFDIVCTKFIELEFIRTNGIAFSTTYSAQEDNDFVFKLFRKADTVVFADFVSFCYYKYNENSVSSSWSAASAMSILDRWSSFYFFEAPNMKLSKEYRDMVAAEKHRFILKARNGLFKLVNQYSEDEAEMLLPVVERFFEKEIRKLPYKKERFSYLYPFYKLIGVRRTVYLFRLLTRIIRGKK